MKYATIAALCAVAPLALAGSLDMDMRSRGLLQDRNDLVLGGESSSSTSVSESSSSKGGKASSNSQNQKANNNGGNNNGDITSITSTESTEVILIWVNEGGNAATSTVNSAAAATQNAAAATHTIVVGGTTKVFTPNQQVANVGDMIVFEFHEQNHTATTSAFTDPCVSNSVFDTGFMPNPNGTITPPPQVGMAVTVATPVWFYCRQTGHCGEGMTFALNPTTNKTQADFEATAIKLNGTGTTAGIASIASAPPAASTVSVAAASSVAVASTQTSAASSSSGSTGLTSAQGTDTSGGACTCAVVCAAGTIPNVAAQGVAAFGGMGASIPMANLASTT